MKSTVSNALWKSSSKNTFHSENVHLKWIKWASQSKTPNNFWFYKNRNNQNIKTELYYWFYFLFHSCVLGANRKSACLASGGLHHCVHVFSLKMTLVWILWGPRAKSDHSWMMLLTWCISRVDVTELLRTLVTPVW